MYNDIVWGNNMDRKINNCNNGFTCLVKPFARISCMLCCRSRNARCSQTKFRSAHSYGFTLAETLIVLVILGVIAMITIPPVIRQHMKAVARTKIKKSMTVYDLAIQKMTVEHDLRTDLELANWANSVADCGNTSPYFKIVSGSGCQFKTSDGVWWNISDILNPAIGLTENDINIFLNGDRDNPKAFAFVTSYDLTTSAFRINDLMWEKSQTPADEQKIEDLEKLFEFLNPNKVFLSDPNDVAQTIVKQFLSVKCTTRNGSSTSCEKYDYDNNGNRTAIYSRCDVNGNNCSNSEKYEYDSNGNLTAEYTCDGIGNNCTDSNKYEYDSNGDQTAYYYGCDVNGNNCSGSNKYEYDSNGNLTSDYYNCDRNVNNCSYSAKYEYDSNGNQTAYYSCDGNGNNCSNAQKYEYDSNGNKTTFYYNCDGNGNNCSNSEKYEYDGKGNQTAIYYNCDGNGNNCYSYKYEYDSNGNKTVYECDSNGNNCSGSRKYEYDSNGNQTAYYQRCDGNGNNCSSSQKYEYDSNGNRTAYYTECDGNGNNCQFSYTYTNTYTDITVPKN